MTFTLYMYSFRCRGNMNQRARAQAGSDGVCWYCPSCKTTKSIRDGSFFSKSKLTLQKWMLAIPHVVVQRVPSNRYGYGG